MNSVSTNDTVFSMSVDGAYRVRHLARELGQSPNKTFRGMAGALVIMPDPKINVSGNPLSARMKVGINQRTLDRLAKLCEELGVPLEAAGELVACTDYVGYSETWK
jgi:hypothetical protein